MKTVVLAASKGGVGKTTLCAIFAVEAARSGKVGLADLDPQHSLARWHELRGEPANPALMFPFGENDRRPIAEVAREASRAGLDWLIVDTPPALMLQIEPAIEIADLVVVPVRPSPLDVEAIDPILDMCEAAGCPFVFVMNAVPPRSNLTTGAITFLRGKGQVLEEMTGYRTSYAGAMLSGKTAAEIDRGEKAEEEVRALWKRVARIVAGEKKKTR